MRCVIDGIPCAAPASMAAGRARVHEGRRAVGCLEAPAVGARAQRQREHTERRPWPVTNVGGIVDTEPRFWRLRPPRADDELADAARGVGAASGVHRCVALVAVVVTVQHYVCAGPVQQLPERLGAVVVIAFAPSGCSGTSPSPPDGVMPVSERARIRLLGCAARSALSHSYSGVPASQGAPVDGLQIAELRAITCQLPRLITSTSRQARVQCFRSSRSSRLRRPCRTRGSPARDRWEWAGTRPR